ncbi:hypothetical protein TL16_g02735 [Triparma laevis f. inornata]|uniref:Asparagine synthetase domain-containing protein n=1 Tax=Triparma laevis f. inornata TaxID=1714386 RepID=A0A9W6ZV73_9STRA|nr:hypothetical protein TL16_g02735 [Triparma laevis f. inornata]
MKRRVSRTNILNSNPPLPSSDFVLTRHSSQRIRTKNLAKPEDKRIEKWAVRKAFDTPDDPYLPDEILWRQKEQFSDGVGYGWVDALKDAAEAEISDQVSVIIYGIQIFDALLTRRFAPPPPQMFENAANRYEYNTPLTKEGFRYRQIFERLFPGKAAYETVPGGKVRNEKERRAEERSDEDVSVSLLASRIL